MSAIAAIFDLVGQLVLPGTPPGGSPYAMTTIAAQPFVSGFLALFLASYPTRARGVAAAPALLAATFAFAAGALWLVARHLLMAGPLDPVNRTLLLRTLQLEGWIAIMLLAIASSLWRVRALPERERRGALLVLSALSVAYVAISGGLVARALLFHVGFFEGVYQNALGLVPGDCCRIAAAYWIASRIVLAPLVAAAFVWRERSWIPALFIVLQFLLVLAATDPTLLLVDTSSVVLPLLIAALTRHGAIGMEQLPAPAAWLAAGGSGLYVFLLAVSQPIANLPGFPLSTPLGVLFGLALGGLTTAFLLPPGRGVEPWLPSGRGQGGAERRLEPYAIAFDREIASGATPEEAFERLRPLRRSLRVSDREHAVLAYARKRAGAAGPDGELTPGSRFLDRYRVLRILREGGMGVTRLARDERMDRPVVIKSLRSRDASTEGVESVLREARALSRIRHANVVTVHDVERVGDEAFIIMEHVEGGSLADRLGAGPIDAVSFRRVATGLLDALAAVHEAGLVHRDVKPSNVLLTPKGDAKLADFGVAHIPGYETTVAALEGGAVGTFRYMSPEQARGRGVTPRSDLFSVGATLFEAWTGTPYLEVKPGESAVELQLRAADAEGFERDIDGPQALRAWFVRALDPVPSRRFADAREMRATLEAALA